MTLLTGYLKSQLRKTKMSDDVSQIILEELRAHRKETMDGFGRIDNRVRSLEESRAEQKGTIKTAVTISGMLSALVAFITSIFYH